MDKRVLVMDLAHDHGKGSGRGSCSPCAMPVSPSEGVLQQFIRMRLGYIARQRQVLMAHGVGGPRRDTWWQKENIPHSVSISTRYGFIITLKIPYRVIVAQSHILDPTFIQVHSLPLGKAHQLLTSFPVI